MLTKEEISEMSVAERLDLIGRLWDSIPPTEVPVPEWHKRALDGASDDYLDSRMARERGDEPDRDWETVRKELGFDR